jgi:hypothetical protein
LFEKVAPEEGVRHPAPSRDRRDFHKARRRGQAIFSKPAKRRKRLTLPEGEREK